MIWARWADVMGVPMKWEIARIFVVGTGGSGFCAEAAPSGVIGFFMAVAPYASFGILLLIVSVFDARTPSAGRCRRYQPSVELLPWPNAGAHLLPEAGAERTLEAVRCSAWLGAGLGSDLGCSHCPAGLACGGNDFEI